MKRVSDASSEVPNSGGKRVKFNLPMHLLGLQNDSSPISTIFKKPSFSVPSAAGEPSLSNQRMFTGVNRGSPSKDPSRKSSQRKSVHKSASAQSSVPKEFSEGRSEDGELQSDEAPTDWERTHSLMRMLSSQSTNGTQQKKVDNENEDDDDEVAESLHKVHSLYLNR